MNNINKGELLAPAGTLEMAITAFKSGADAVYAGFDRFNAREMNKNFSFDDMSKLSEYCKKHQVKYHNTFNTLIKEDEIELFMGDIEKAVSLEPDALIIQDIGAAALVKKLFPSQVIHASTQMGIHNHYGVAAAVEMGFDRVILERQVTIEELKEIKRKSSVELEVFVHGALCCSLSGCCLFSSWIGGYSGNRGKCKQPCRRRYYPDDSSTNGFFFSPSDLCMIGKMKELMEIGIDSFKIEGRLKRLDYVINTVTAYRKMIDAVLEGTEKKQIGESKKILSLSPGRLWSPGFASPESMEQLIQEKKPGISGRLCGKVLSHNDQGVNIEATSFIRKGDRLRFQSSSGNEMPSFTLLKMKNLSRHSENIKPGEKAIIFTDIKPERDSRLFISGRSISYGGPSLENLPLFIPRKDVHLSVEIDCSQIRIKTQLNGISGSYQFDQSFEKAENRAADIEKLKQVFSQTANKEYRSSQIEINVIDSPFIPMSLLKKIRRDFWTQFIEDCESNHDQETKIEIGTALSNALKTLKSEALLSESIPLISSTLAASGSRSAQSVIKSLRGTLSGKPIIALPLDSVRDSDAKETILPSFCPQFDLDKEKQQIISLIKGGMRRFRICSIYQTKLFEEIKNELAPHLTDKIELIASFPIPVLNQAAGWYLLRLTGRVQLWIEQSKEELVNLIEKMPSKSIEQFAGGYPSLLTSRAGIPYNGSFKDSRGIAFNLTENNIVHQLYAEKVFTPDQLNSISLYFEYRSGKLGNKEESRFNFDYKLV